MTGLIIGHAQAMTGQAIGFLIIDRMHLPPAEALHPTGLVLMMGAGASLLAQWGLIPMLDLRPRALVLTGAALGAIGCVATGTATTLYGIALGYALTALGMGFARPGFTAWPPPAPPRSTPRTHSSSERGPSRSSRRGHARSPPF